MLSALASRPISHDKLTHIVNAVPAKSSPRPVARCFAAGLMLCLWLALGLASSSTQLHHALHQDSHQTSHDCVLTLLSKGLMTGSVSTGLMVLAPVMEEWTVTAPYLFAAVSSDVRLAPERAPPGWPVFSPASG